jgi:thioredoxin-like negative regulator of GroEL
VDEPLSDLEQTAAARWGLAQVDLMKDDYESARQRMAESFQIMGFLRRHGGIAIVGWTLGQLLIAAGDTDEARRVLGDALAGATQVDWREMVQRIELLLNDIDRQS